jgi:hypothetical protein
MTHLMDFKVLEYTLFQPGMFLDYLASPHKTAKYVTPLDTFIDFQNRRAIVVEGHENAVMTYTAVRDIAEIVVRAVAYEGEWPKIGGIRGNRVSVRQMLEIGERVRGRPFAVDRVKLEDLKSGNFKTPWSLARRHPKFTDDSAPDMESMLRSVLAGTLLSCVLEAWDVSDEFNCIFPDYEFAGVERFLESVWKVVP